ncbi:MAG: helix-turn-helix domain-containing protein [Gammaproteobacteria bacterium]|nr:MAG: helix-turn-helix domain-containing protein [Gammaproteobacteria bacterium]
MGCLGVSVSASATFWAWNQSVKSSHKLVLLSLANCHNDSTGQCNPSIKYISDQTGLNRKTVLSSLSALEEMDLIIPRKSSGSSNSYRLNTSAEIGTTSVGLTSTKNGTAAAHKTSTKSGTSTKNGPVPKTDKTSTKNGTGVVPNLGHEPKKNLKEPYKYENRTIKLIESDYDRIVSTYPNLSFPEELDQLDLELSGEKKWFMALNAKLNYRNKQARASHGTHNQPDKPRSPAERFRARREAEQRNHGPALGANDGDLRPQVGEQLRSGTYGRVGALIDGDYTSNDG